MVLAPPKIYKQQDFDTASAADMDIKTGCETKKNVASIMKMELLH